MPQEFVIEDARTFYQTIKTNPLYSDLDEEEVVAILLDHWKTRDKAADMDGRRGSNRAQYFFFQGMLAGCLMAWKMAKHHYEVLQSREPKGVASVTEN